MFTFFGFVGLLFLVLAAIIGKDSLGHKWLVVLSFLLGVVGFTVIGISVMLANGWVAKDLFGQTVRLVTIVLVSSCLAMFATLWAQER